MGKNFSTKINSLSNIASTLTNAVALFVVFRVSYRIVGAPMLGIWTLIQSLMLISRISDAGSFSNLTRLVAIEKARQGPFRLRGLIIGGFVVSSAPIIVIGLVCAWPIYAYITFSYPIAADNQTSVQVLIACSLIFGVFNSAASVLAGCMDGLGLMATRGLIVAVGNVLFIAISMFLIPSFGVLGLGVAYIASSLIAVALLSGGLYFSHVRNALGPYRSTTIGAFIRGSLKFNFDLLLISLLRLLLDPSTKVIVGYLGSLDTVPIFDLATKITSQVRLIFSAAAQAILPIASREHFAVINAATSKYFTKAHATITIFSFYAFTASVLFLPAASFVGFGHLNMRFLEFSVLLAVGNLLNSLGLVAYYVEIGGGMLRSLVRIHFVMAVANIALGLALGYELGVIGAVLAASISVAYGGIACWFLHWRTLIDHVRFGPRIIIPSLFSLLIAVGAFFLSLTVGERSPLLLLMYLGGLMSMLFAVFVYYERDFIATLLNGLLGRPLLGSPPENTLT